MGEYKPWHMKPEYFAYAAREGKYKPNKALWIGTRRRHWLNKYKSEVGCKDCGTKDARVLTFDHRDPSLKELSIGGGKMAHISRRAEIIEEVRKCDVRCHNCHHIKTDKENERGRKPVDSQQRQADFEAFEPTWGKGSNRRR